MSRQRQRQSHKVGHFAKCCKTKQAKDPNDKKPRRKKPRGPRDTKRSVNQINSEDSPDSEYALTIVDGKQPMIQVNVGGVPNVAMSVDSGASCNVIDRELWEELRTFAPKNFPHTDFFKTLTDGRK